MDSTVVDRRFLPEAVRFRPPPALVNKLAPTPRFISEIAALAAQL
jgi:hypothetical protein